MLALFGVASDLNLMMWQYGVGYLGKSIGLVFVAADFFVYDSARTDSSNENLALAETVRKELIFFGLVETLANSTLYFHSRSWYASYSGIEL